ncbi:hypothetical protein, partial [uncultured Fusobacterium sp.]|uniref:hypothetical protein n=1 Tax=uncultured Fusobacterium sp. TaxID=159267 RepID=UPI0025D25002
MVPITQEIVKAVLKKVIISSCYPFSLDSTLDILNYKKEGGDTEDNKNESLESLKKQIGLIREVAISRRIDTAEKVTIEEFYENKEEGHIGITASQEGAGLGIGSNEEKVVKRVYIFEGWREGGLDLLGKEYLEKIL